LDETHAIPEYQPYLRIVGKRVHRFGGCSMADLDCQQTLKTTRLRLKRTGEKRWENWGHTVAAFRPGDWGEAEIITEVLFRHDNNFIYCASSISTIYPGTRD
jgi:hypothetical protein